MRRVNTQLSNRVHGACVSAVPRTERGETLVETLVAMLIASLSLLALATTISTASNIIRNNAAIAQNYYTSTSTLAAMSTEGDANDSVTITTKHWLASSDVTASAKISHYASAELPGKSGGGKIDAVSYMTGA